MIIRYYNKASNKEDLDQNKVIREKKKKLGINR